MTLSEAALQYVGVPFKHQGRTTAGLDCAGLLLLAAKDCGYLAENTPVYPPEPRDGHMAETLLDHGCVPVERDLQVNDIIVTRLRPGGPVVHVGIITDHPHGLGVVHTYGLVGRVVHQRLDESKRQLIAGVFEWHAKS